jgi:hypothetical protein
VDHFICCRGLSRTGNSACPRVPSPNRTGQTRVSVLLSKPICPLDPAASLCEVKFVRGLWRTLREKDVNFYCSKSLWVPIYFLLSVRLLPA